MGTSGGMPYNRHLAFTLKTGKVIVKGYVLRHLLAILFLCMALSVNAIGAHDHSGVSSFVVSVTNGTAHGRSTTGDEVVLTIYQNSQPIETSEGVIDSTGKAFFDNIPVGDQLLAVARVKHYDMMFSSRVIQIKHEPSEHFAPVEVYDTSDDTSLLSIGTHHVIIDVQPDGISFTEYLQLRNPSDKAIFSKNKDSKDRSIVVEMDLPEGFKELSFTEYFNDSVIVTTKSGFYDTLAVPPGNYDCVFTYFLGIKSETMTFEKQIIMPTSNLTVFVQTNGTTVTGLGQPHGSMTMQNGSPAEYYNLSETKTPDKMTFEISGLNAPETYKDLWILMCIIFGVVGLLVVTRLRPAKSESNSVEQ